MFARKDDIPFDDARHAYKIPPALIGVAVLAVVVIAVGLVAVFGIGPNFSPVVIEKADGAQMSDAANQDSSVQATDQSSNSVICVHVTGAVNTPGLYELPAGSRVGDAIAAAGGLSEDAVEASVNLARVLTDGEQIYVQALQNVTDNNSADQTVDQPNTAISGGKININQADADTLDSLPGVGASTAAKIIADREANGPFSSTEDLMRVSGIGEKKFAQLADFITIG